MMFELIPRYEILYVGLQFWTKNLLQIGDSTFMRINLYTSIYGKFFSIKNLKWQNGKMAKWQNGKMAKWQKYF
jgi:hypothetical protein